VQGALMSACVGARVFCVWGLPFAHTALAYSGSQLAQLPAAPRWGGSACSIYLQMGATACNDGGGGSSRQRRRKLAARRTPDASCPARPHGLRTGWHWGAFQEEIRGALAGRRGTRLLEEGVVDGALNYDDRIADGQMQLAKILCFVSKSSSNDDRDRAYRAEARACWFVAHFPNIVL
jgi:hypothetical protein